MFVCPNSHRIRKESNKQILAIFPKTAIVDNIAIIRHWNVNGT